jgi:hypothetical protein
MPEDPEPFDDAIFDLNIFDTEPLPAGTDDYSYPIGRGLWDDYGLRASIARYRAGRAGRF